MQSLIALASVSGSALGTPPASLPFALKIGRTTNVHPGEIADGRNWREAHNMPATAVPWRQAALPDNEHLSFGVDASSRSLALAKPRWSLATGPSINPMTTCALPLVSAISVASINCCNGSMALVGVIAAMSNRAFLGTSANHLAHPPGISTRESAKSCENA